MTVELSRDLKADLAEARKVLSAIESRMNDN